MTYKRKEQIGDCTLYLGDCLEVMPTLGKVDAVVTDPPYGIGFKYKLHNDNPKSYRGGYGNWIKSVVDSFESILSESSPVFIWQTQKNIKMFSKWFKRDWRLFCAAKNFVQMRPTPMQYSYDPVVVWWTDGEEKPYSLGTKSRDFHIANTAPVIGQSSNIERQHPCPRPLDQVLHIVQQWCKPRGTILDPFMGSGTTLVACAKMGRKGVGIEIDPDYFDIACKRVEDAYRQGDLFIEQPKPEPEMQQGEFLTTKLAEGDL